MNRPMTMLVALAALFAAPATLAELKVGVVDVNQAVGQTQRARQFLEQVQSELQPDQERIRELTAEKSRIEERVERDGAVMSESERSRLAEDYDRVTSDLKYRTETYQRSLQRRRNELFQSMGPRVQAALQELVEDEGYDLVVPTGAVIFAKESFDITSKLAEKLDASR